VASYLGFETCQGSLQDQCSIFGALCPSKSGLMNKHIMKQGGLGADLVPETEPDAAAKTREPPPPILNFPSATAAVASGYWSDWTHERSLMAVHSWHLSRARRECKSILALWNEDKQVHPSNASLEGESGESDIGGIPHTRRART
jgi:hypothetical protein